MSRAEPVVGVIGGSGLENLQDLREVRERFVVTPWGSPSAPLRFARLGALPVVFLPRHGVLHDIPPHRVNYRANLWALREHGARAVVGLSAVGTIAPWLAPGGVALPEQLIDYTWGRAQSFWDAPGEPMRHIEFTAPVDVELHRLLEASAANASSPVAGRGVYGVTQGPRLETAAEIQRLRRDGCDMVGMTLMPEAGLARELALPYANVSYAVNLAAGCGDEDLHDQAQKYLRTGARAAVDLLLHASDVLVERYT